MGKILGPLGHNIEDYTGQKYNRLTFVSPVPREDKAGQYWACVCECGTLKVIHARNIVLGKTKSCGCLRKENSLRMWRENMAKWNEENPEKTKAHLALANKARLEKRRALKKAA
jgi:hypothetical protein